MTTIFSDEDKEDMTHRGRRAAPMRRMAVPIKLVLIAIKARTVVYGVANEIVWRLV